MLEVAWDYPLQSETSALLYLGGLTTVTIVTANTVI